MFEIESVCDKITNAHSHMIRLFSEFGKIKSYRENGEIIYYHPEIGELGRISQDTLKPIRNNG